MTDAEFDKMLEDRLKGITSLLKTKNEEYAKTGTFHNFDRAAQILQCSPERALVGFWTKHLVSVLDLLEDLEAPERFSDERFQTLWREKIGDLIAYGLLLDIMVRGKFQ